MRFFGMVAVWLGLCVASGVAGSDDDLLDAAKRGDLAALNQALEAGADPNGRPGQLTPLHFAVAKRIADGKTVEPTPQLAKRLLKAGANVNATDHLKQTPLEWAAAYGSKDAVAMLIRAGADVNAESVYGTALGRTQTVEVAKLLIEAGADVNATVRGTTPLMNAAKHSKAALIRLLVENGATVNDPRNPAMHWAAKPEIARTLIELGADVNLRNSQGQTALHVLHGDWADESVKILINSGADIRARCKDGRTPLHTAVLFAKPEIFRLLIGAGADVDAKDKHGNTPLSIARANHDRYKEQGRDLGPAKAVLAQLRNAKDDGMTEFQKPVINGEIDKVKAWIAGGGNVNEVGPGGTRAVHLASKHGQTEVLAVLIAAGAEFDAIDQAKMRPLHLAANVAIARTLIKRGAKLDGRPSPLDVAIMEGRAAMVRELLAAGAASELTQRVEKLSWAVFYGHEDVVRVFLDLPERQALLQAPALESPLHIAAAGALGSFRGLAAPKTNTLEKRLALAKLLIAKGVPVDSRFGHADLVNRRSPMVEYLDSTPLMFAAAKGDEAMVRFLLKSGADVNAKNRGDKTPADFAANDSIKKLLAR